MNKETHSVEETKRNTVCEKQRERQCGRNKEKSQCVRNLNM